MRQRIKNVTLAAIVRMVGVLIASSLAVPALGQDPASDSLQGVQAVVEEVAVTPAATPEPESALVADAGKSGTVTLTGGTPPRTLMQILLSRDGVDIITDNPVPAYTVFPVTNPNRLVLDLPGVRNGIGAGLIPIGLFDITSAQLGEQGGKSRIVFNGANDAILKATVINTSKGLRLIPPPSSMPVAKASPTVAKAAPASESKGASSAETKTSPAPDAKPSTVPSKDRDGSPTAVDSIDFSVVDNGSRITMKVGAQCVAVPPTVSAEGLTFVVKKCSLPRDLQRTIDTSAFPSMVRSIVPYQVSVKGGAETRVLVKLSGTAPYKLRQDNGVVTLDITHPKQEQKAEKPAPAPDVAAASQGTAPPVTPAVVPNPAAQKMQDLAAAAPGTKKTYTGRRVTLEFVDADIRKIFQLIADVSNLNILMAEDVSGTITLKLVNVPWDQALDIILETKNLGMKADGNIVQIKPKGKFKTADEEILEAKKTREKMMELQTRVFDVNFALPGDVVGQFKTLGSGRPDSSITPDERTNKVIVTDIEPAINRMKQFLETIDVPEKQVLIEARIVQADTNFNRELGIQWGIHYRDPTGSFMGINSINSGFGGKVSQPPLIGSSGPGMATGISFGTLASNVNVDLKISALAEASLAKIISTPKIVTLNNKPAKITQGQSIPYQNTTANTGAVTQFVEAALTLEVTPHITPDGSVMMKIKASNNSPGTGSAPPPINKKEATTELLVKSGETTVIGGIYVDNDNEANSGVPYLMDIPLIGWLFKSNSITKTKSELLIFITPRILI